MQSLVVQTGEGSVFVPVSSICIHAVCITLEGWHVAMGQNDPVEPVAAQERLGLFTQNVGRARVLVALMKPTADPLREPDPHIGRQECSVERHRHGVAKQSTQPRPRLIVGSESIAMGQVQAVSQMSDFHPLRLHRHAEFRRKVIPMPGVVIAEKVRDGDSPVGPAGEESLEPDEALWDEVPVLDVPIEYVSKEVQVVDGVFVCPQTVEEGLLLVPLRRAGSTAKVHIGDEKNHRIDGSQRQRRDCDERASSSNQGPERTGDRLVGPLAPLGVSSRPKLAFKDVLFVCRDELSTGPPLGFR